MNTSTLDLANALNWLLPPAEKLEPDGETATPILAMREIAEGSTEFLRKALDVLHAQGIDALEEHIVDWVEATTGETVEASGAVLYGIPIVYLGFEPDYDGTPSTTLVIALVRYALEREIAIDSAKQLPLYPPYGAPSPDQLPLVAGWDARVSEEITPGLLYLLSNRAIAPPYDELEESDEDDEGEPGSGSTANDINGSSSYEALRWKVGGAIGLVHNAIVEANREERCMEQAWLDVAWAIGWIFGQTSNTIVDYSYDNASDDGMEWPPWSSFADIKEIRDEAARIVTRAHRGIDIINSNPTVRGWLLYNLLRARKLIEKHGSNANARYREITWPTLTTAVERWADSPARHLRQRPDPAQPPT